MIQRLHADDRGVSEVIGAILVFAVLVLLLSIMQTQAVPNQNQEVEFQHSLEVQSDLVQFHQTGSAVAADGSERSVAFTTGTGYPSRLLFFNPPRVRGTLETTDSENIVIDNAVASSGEVNQYVSEGFSPTGSPTANQLELPTRRLVYQVDYNEINNQPTTRYEYGVLYNEFDNGGFVVQNQGTIIDGTSINLLFLEGDSTVSSTAEKSLPVQPVSAPARSVTVTAKEDASGNLQPITIELPSRLSEQKWIDLYGGATNVQSISKPSPTDPVTITLDPGTTSNPKQYNLRMSKIAVESNVDSPDPHYIVPADPGVTSAGVGQDAAIEYEVRDKFNNPVSGAEVEVPTTSGTTTKTTNDQGRVSTTVSTSQNADFTAELTGQSATAANCGSTSSGRCEAAYRVQVPGLNLNPSSGVVVAEATTTDVLGLGGNLGLPLGSNSVATVTLESTTGNNVGIERIRMNHYNPDPDGHNQSTFSDGTRSVTLNIGGGFKQPSNSFAEVTPGGTDYGFAFEASVDSGDYFVITVVYDNNERALYFISP